jgi:hypothetical protein
MSSETPSWHRLCAAGAAVRGGGLLDSQALAAELGPAVPLVVATVERRLTKAAEADARLG